MPPPPADALPPFPGFRPEALQFLRDLRAHNEREWFKPRKSTYEDELLWPARCLIAQLTDELPRRGIPLRGTPKKSVFRIYRDTRFSKNKAPYKTHVGLVLSQTGSKNDPGALYIHVEPDGGSFLAAGFWRPESPLLRRWRERIVNRPDEFVALAEGLREDGLRFQATGDNTLKRMPRGFEGYADAPWSDYLKWKGGFVALEDTEDAALLEPAFTERVEAFARRALPLLEYGWDVAETAPA